MCEHLRRRNESRKRHLLFEQYLSFNLCVAQNESVAVKPGKAIFKFKIHIAHILSVYIISYARTADNLKSYTKGIKILHSLYLHSSSFYLFSVFARTDRQK